MRLWPWNIGPRRYKPFWNLWQNTVDSVLDPPTICSPVARQLSEMSDSTLTKSPWMHTLFVSEHGEDCTTVCTPTPSMHRSRLQRMELSDTHPEQTPFCQKASHFIKLFCWFILGELGFCKPGRQRCLLCKAGHAVIDGPLNNTKLKVSGSNQECNFYIVNGERLV